MKTILVCSAILFLLLPSPLFAFHDDPAQTRCLDCHQGLPFEQAPVLFQGRVMDVCRSCHPADHISVGVTHPVDVVPSMPMPADMPLDGRGKIACITCHFFHPDGESGGKRYESLLRRQVGRNFCITCHEKV